MAKLTPKMSEKTLGDFYKDAKGNLWKMISYSDDPTVTLQMVGTQGIRRSGVVGAPIFEEFVHLVEEAP